ncbi:hypothetical protein Q1695_001254 [Nippostrongylus brasiliensis]|nr:hypothetical protein Q1695_001254 [Nippostrongylus brasiliensis]
MRRLHTCILLSFSPVSKANASCPQLQTVVCRLKDRDLQSSDQPFNRPRILQFRRRTRVPSKICRVEDRHDAEQHPFHRPRDIAGHWYHKTRTSLNQKWSAMIGTSADTTIKIAWEATSRKSIGYRFIVIVVPLLYKDFQLGKWERKMFP